MIYIDTSALIRYFSKDIPQKSQIVFELLKSNKKKYITDAVFPELEYVLREDYSASRLEILGSFKYLDSIPTIKLKPYVREAILIYASSTLDMADCLIASYAMKGRLVSFDEGLLKLPGVKAYWKRR